MGATADPEDTWVAPSHEPGPAAPTDGSVFEDPRFSGHIAFLQRMQQQGFLIAAGPFPAEHGSGMTILRLPGPGRWDEATRLATEEDAAVTSGLLSVTVRHWDVIFTTVS